jgi:ribonuclease D
VRDLSPLAPVLADATVTKIFHGADYDVTTLKRDFGFQFGGLFDTMIAARLLGRTEFGLQALVRAELGIELEKGAQKDDWSRRPLTQRQIQYALADVAHLVPLQQRLEGELIAKGRLDWLREEVEAVGALPAARRRVDPDSYQRVKGAKELSPRGLAILREVHAWREGLAEKTNIPAFKIVQPGTLLQIASAPITTREALARLPDLRRWGREVPTLFAAIERAQQLPENALPQWVKQPWIKMSGEVRRRVEALQRLRTKLGAATGLDPSLVLSQKLIDRIAETAPSNAEALAAIEGVRRWRVVAWGSEILTAIAAP